MSIRLQTENQYRRLVGEASGDAMLARSPARLNASVVTIPLATIIITWSWSSNASFDAEAGLLFAAWALTLGLLGGLLTDLLLYGVSSVFRAEHVLMLGVIIIVYPELLQAFYSTGLDLSNVKTTFEAIALFSWMAAVGSSFAPLSVPAAVVSLAKRQYSKKFIFRLILLCWLLFMLNIGIATNFSPNEVISGLLADRWSAPWSRGQLGGWEAFRDFLNNFGYVVPTLTTVLAIRYRSWRATPVLVALGASAITIIFIAQSGSRRLIVVPIGAALLTWLCSQHKNLKLRNYLLLIAIAAANVIFLDIVLASRDTGVSEFLYTADRFQGLKVDDNFTSLGQTLRVVPAETDFVNYRFIWYVLVRPIPRVVWPDKPTGSGFDLADHLGTKGIAFAITAIGELYVSFGWVGIGAGGVLFGWFSRSWSDLYERDYGVFGTALYGLGAMALFLGVRSLLELVLMSYPILCWLSLDRLMLGRTWTGLKGISVEGRGRRTA